MYKRSFSILLRVIISSHPGCPTTLLPFIKYLLPGKPPYPKIIHLQCHIIVNNNSFSFKQNAISFRHSIHEENKIQKK